MRPWKVRVAHRVAGDEDLLGAGRSPGGQGEGGEGEEGGQEAEPYLHDSGVAQGIDDHQFCRPPRRPPSRQEGDAEHAENTADKQR